MNNEKFYQTYSPDILLEITWHRNFALPIVRNMEYGEDLFVNYGSSYICSALEMVILKGNMW